MNRLLKSVVLTAVRKLTRHNVMFLPLVSGDQDSLISLKYRYRISGDILTIKIREPLGGKLRVELFPADAIGGKPLAMFEDIVLATDLLRIDLPNGTMTLGDNHQTFSTPPAARKFVIRFRLDSGGKIKTRTTAHYLPWNDKEIDEHYYNQATYVDYESQNQQESQANFEWLLSYLRHGRVLEVGCATGLLLEKLTAEGFDTYGLDISKWAIEKARNRVQPDHVACVNVETDDVPFEGPFDAIMLHAVLEHFRHPWAVLGKLDGLAREGTLLFCHTSNADSLTKMLFGEDWEGYFDYSHYGVDLINARRMRHELAELGWEILQFTTSGFWLGNEDESGVSLRQLYAYDSRFRTLLEERELGDFITLVAKRTKAEQSIGARR